MNTAEDEARLIKISASRSVAFKIACTPKEERQGGEGGEGREEKERERERGPRDSFGLGIR